MTKKEIIVPSMGESVVEATVGRLLKQAGSFVKESEEIIELETEKVNQVLYAPATGRLTWQVKEGDNVGIGAILGVVEEGAEVSSKEEKPVSAPPKKEEPPTEQEKGGRIQAEEWVGEIKKPKSSAPKPSVIQKEQPEQKEKPTAKIEKEGAFTRKPLSTIRRTIAKRLVDALHQAAMLTTFNEVDMSAVMELRTRHQEGFQQKHGVKLGFMSFFVKAVVEALKTYPAVNSRIEGENILEWHTYDISIAVGTEKGLVVPVVKECDQLSFAEIERRIQDFAKRAREGKLKVDELKGGNFTITNGGVYGSLLSTPLLNPPQSAILGMHKIQKRAVVVNEEIVIRPMMYLALSYDHRLIDGKEAVTFLIKIKEVLEDPSLLLFDGE